MKRGWRPYGGILREVYLVIADPLHLSSPVVVTGADGTLEIHVDALNEHGYSVNARVQVVLHTAEGEPLATWLTDPQTLSPGSQSTFSLQVKAEVSPWSPENPVLYPLALRLLADGRVTDEVTQRIGFRTIERRGTQLYLNGQPVYLRGFNRHEDTAATGMTPNPEQTERDLQHIRSLGCNFVRLCHYPHHPSTLDICDRLGLLVMAKIPLYWWDGLAEGEEMSQRKWQLARQQLHEMIERDRREKAVCEHLRRAFGVAPPAAVEPEPSEDMYVRMVRPHLLHIPDVSLPEGFAVRPYQPGDERVWTDIWRDAEPFLTIDDDLFGREFGSDRAALRWRCFFIVDERGSAVGTVTAWYSRDFKGQDWGRIHWLAVRPAYQGRGLAKAALTFALKQLAQWHERAWLDTSSGRLGAIKIYLDFGFVPDMEAPGAKVAWQQVQQKLNHPVLARYV